MIKNVRPAALLLLLVACLNPSQEHVESEIYRVDYPDAGISCWVLHNNDSPSGISCVKLSPQLVGIVRVQ